MVYLFQIMYAVIRLLQRLDGGASEDLCCDVRLVRLFNGNTLQFSKLSYSYLIAHTPATKHSNYLKQRFLEIQKRLHCSEFILLHSWMSSMLLSTLANGVERHTDLIFRGEESRCSGLSNGVGLMLLWVKYGFGFCRFILCFALSNKYKCTTNKNRN